MKVVGTYSEIGCGGFFFFVSSKPLLLPGSGCHLHSSQQCVIPLLPPTISKADKKNHFNLTLL
jgi:hypothetical protein